MRTGGTHTPEEGADVPVQLALLRTADPTGTFRGSMDDSADETIPW
ncbi:hypothetical protein [Streptomyces platensis]